MLVKRTTAILALALVAALWQAPAGLSESVETMPVAIKLPAPDTSGGRPLMAALNDRRSERSFGPAALSDQQTAEILWAAVGVNRPEDGNRRTSPTAMNRQDVEVYALTAKGAFHYNALKHELEYIKVNDQSGLLGAPLGLVFTAPADSAAAGINVGFCSQNVYLYAASEGLNSIVKITVDREALAKVLDLGEDRQIVAVQLIGPKP